MLEGWCMCGAGNDVLGWVEGAACPPGTMQMEGMCTALHSAAYGRSPLIAVCAPADIIELRAYLQSTCIAG